MTTRVVLVRPWTDARGGGGCCGGDARDGICLDRRADGPREPDAEVGLVGEVYLRVRAALPEVDVQIVGADNTAYLLPSVFRAVRSRRGVLTALRETARATTAGAVLVNGEKIGDVTALGADGVLEEVRRRAGSLIR